MFKIKIRNLLLLTGAGFTKNFGGFLAAEMWEQIFNNPIIQECENVRQLLLEDFNYESVYSQVVTGSGFSDEHRTKLRNAIQEAYKALDNATKTRGLPGSPYLPNVLQLLNLFGGNSGDRGLVFTANQDLWLERQAQCNCPGVPDFSPGLYDCYDQELATDKFITFTAESASKRAPEDVENRNGLIYLKLHGSYGWTATDNPEQLVIGTQKESIIKGHPLFSWYFDVLKWAISRGKQRILIIGYGFGDEHINKILLDGVEKHGLRVYIISPMRLFDLAQQMAGGHYYALPLLKGIRGYYPYRLDELYPADQRVSEQAKRLQQALSQ